MDGFITSGTFPVALNRLQDAMVTTLAIEQLTSPNEMSQPLVTITAPSIAGDMNVGTPSSQGSAAPSSAKTKATATKTPKPTATPTTAAYKSNDAADSAPELANSRPGQNRDSVANAPDPGFVKVAGGAAPGPTPTATPTPSPKPAPAGKKTSAKKPASPSPSAQATKAASGGEAPISPEVANAVRQMVSIYQFKNLDEFCLTVGASELQANFQIGYRLLDVPNPDLAKVQDTLKQIKEIEDQAHIWKYCDPIIDKLKQEGSAPTPTPTPCASAKAPAGSGTGAKKKSNSKAVAPTSFVTSSYR